jgi:hypothetical protein
VTELTPAWIDAYEARRIAPQPTITGTPVEAPETAPTPHEVQAEALAALRATRAKGYGAGLVVLATGLGKTFLAAFDSADAARVLFVAHREEILTQAMAAFRAVRPRARLGRYSGEEKDAEADIVFASVQTLARNAHLTRFDPRAFDYIVVDEFHHAAAATYRRIIDHFQPGFLLGLTATPDRSDGGDLLGLCEENLVYECDLWSGSTGGFWPLPLFRRARPGRIRPDPLAQRAVRRGCPDRSRRHPGPRRKRARAARQTRRQEDHRLLRVPPPCRFHGRFRASPRPARRGGPFGRHLRPSGQRAEGAGGWRSRHRLRRRHVQRGRRCALDRHGADAAPHRKPGDLATATGPRPAPVGGKTHLAVIDYIGNHRIFLTKFRTLLKLGAGDGALRLALERLNDKLIQFPVGCEVTYDLQALDILRSLIRQPRDGEELAAFYRDFRERHGTRPTASEVQHAGFNPGRTGHAGWLGFVADMGDLSEAQRAPGPRIARFWTRSRRPA